LNNQPTPEEELAQLQQTGHLRTLREVTSPHPPHLTHQGRTLINFASNDYLGFSKHPALIQAATKALTDYGTGSTASRLISGSLHPHHQLEEQIAHHKKTDAALTFANGYATALGTVPTIVKKGDTVILDKLAHASLIDAARLSGATLRIFPHNDLNKLEKLLISSKGRTLIITESVFSMDGDLCPLREIVNLKEQHGALLLLDEAHALGILGPTGQGLAEELNLQAQIDFQMGTLGKAIGSAGGYLAATQPWIDLLINKARSLIYSTAPPPAQTAASLAGLNLLQSPEGQAARATLLNHCAAFNSSTPIIPHHLGENSHALEKSQQLLDQGYLVPAIRFPTVPRGTARLRITLTAAHTPQHISDLQKLL